MVEKPLFTCDLEDWNHALHIPKSGHTSIDEFYYLLEVLDRHKVKAIFYVLKRFTDEVPIIEELLVRRKHVIKSHGINHFRHEEADRKPYAWLGFTGGFYFRALPYWFVKSQVLKTGNFYCHPHDFDQNHPVLSNPFMNWKRHVGLKTVKKKLERLLREIEWRNPWE